MGASRRWILGVAAVGCATAVGGTAAIATAPVTAGSPGARSGERIDRPSARATGCGGVQRFAPGRRAIPGRAPLAIGDSVLLGAAPAVAARGYEVDVRGCRQMSE